MPLINGIKMACEPCIRGHRSTKCTHANERLMVPVRKPGRPLSVCPHPQDRPCGCGSVTAAIPRRQQCGCGTSAPTPPASKVRQSSQSSDPLSPTKGSFRVQKTSKPASRKQSLDPATFERAGMKFNFMANETSSQPTLGVINGHMQVQNSLVNGYMMAPQYATPMTLPPSDMAFTNGWTIPVNGYAAVTPSEPTISEVTVNTTNGIKTEEGESPEEPQVSSCCAPKKKPDPPVASCCAGKKTTPKSKEPTSNLTMPLSNTGLSYAVPATLPQQTFPIFTEQPTVFAFPPNYGSYQNPLDPLGWQKLFEAQMLQTQMSGGMSLLQPMGTMDSLHSCACGDSCQCIGCAMHPYNEATQSYVRSAMKSSHDFPEPFTPTNGQTAVQNNGLGHITPPTAHTPPDALSPSDTGSVSINGDEQSLSASDYFFVNYPFNEDSCGGDDQSCPCGDDCACLGCTIHRNPA